jgi:hypothetical protein
MQYPAEPSPPEAIGPGGSERIHPVRDEAAGLAADVKDHHFEYPTVAPISTPGPPATRQW